MAPLPLVSVVVATYRREQIVREAIASALAQENVSVEVIVVDDSGDASARASVEGIGDPRVRYLARETNSGRRPGIVRNDGAALTRGQYIHFLDDDDRLAVGALADLVEAIDGGTTGAEIPGAGRARVRRRSRQRPGMAFGRVLPFGEDDGVLAHERSYFDTAAFNAHRLGGSKLRFATQLLFCNTCLINSACLVRRDVFEQLAGFDALVPVIEDVDFFLRVGREYGYVFVDRPVLHYRTGAPSITSGLHTGRSEPVLAGYRRMYAKYKARHGAAEFYSLKFAVRGRAALDRVATRVTRTAARFRRAPPV